MPKLTDYTSYVDAHRQFSKQALWDLFDGDRGNLNIAHECVDRHAGAGACVRTHNTSANYPITILIKD